MPSLSKIIDEIIVAESSDYTDHPEDRGGPTKYGITLKSLSDFRGRQCTPAEVERLTEAEARNIYMLKYVRGPGFVKIIDERLLGLVVDCGVNHGTARATRWLQEIVGVIQDGVFGPLTADAVNRHEPRKLFIRLLGIRIRFYGRLITDDPRQAKFAAGWMNRAVGFFYDL